MKIILILLCNLFFISCSIAQEKKTVYHQIDNCKYYYDKKLKRNIYIQYDKRAEYPDTNGEIAFQQFILNNANIKKVSNIIYEQGVSLSCICTLVIREDGTPLSFTISTEENEREEITRFKRETEKIVLEKSKKWIPAECKGEKVTSLFHFPLRFLKQ